MCRLDIGDTVPTCREKSALRMEISAQFYWPTAADGVVNRGHDFHVAEAFFAGDAGRFVINNAAGEVVHFGGEMIDLWEVHLALAGAPLQSAVPVGGVELEPAAVGGGKETVHAVDEISGAAGRDEPARPCRIR